MLRDDNDDDSLIDRRKFLRNTTLTAGSMMAVPSVAATSSSEQSQSRVSRETVLSTEKVTIRRIQTDEQVTLLRYDWEKDTVEYAKLGQSSEAFSSESEGSTEVLSQQADSNPQSVSLKSMSPSVQSTGQIVEDATGLDQNIGSCQSWYNRHQYSAVGLRLKDDLDSIYTAVGSAVLCDVIFRFVAKKASLLAKLLQSNKLAAAIDGVCGWLINQLIEAIDGSVLTLGAWDIDTGYLDWPEIALGSSSGYGDGHGQLYKFISIDVAHLETL